MQTSEAATQGRKPFLIYAYKTRARGKASVSGPTVAATTKSTPALQIPLQAQIIPCQLVKEIRYDLVIYSAPDPPLQPEQDGMGDRLLH
jgi:hypothetical protein